MRLFKLLGICLLYVCLGYSNVGDHLKKITDKSAVMTIRNVDFMYMINLDERPEKYETTLKELEPFGIVPYRFSAVNEWKLDLEVLNMEYTLPDDIRLYTVMDDVVTTQVGALSDNGSPSYEKNSEP